MREKLFEAIVRHMDGLGAIDFLPPLFFFFFFLPQMTLLFSRSFLSISYSFPSFSDGLDGVSGREKRDILINGD